MLSDKLVAEILDFLSEQPGGAMAGEVHPAAGDAKAAGNFPHRPLFEKEINLFRYTSS
jgi:hypothetical protein